MERKPKIKANPAISKSTASKAAKAVKKVRAKRVETAMETQQTDPLADVVDPEQIHSEETEFKQPAPMFQLDKKAFSEGEEGSEDSSDEQDYDDDFEEGADLSAGEDIDSDEAGDGDAAADEPEQFLSANEMAKLYVEFYDATQTPIIKALYRKEFLTKEELSEARKIHSRLKVGETFDVDERQAALMARYKEVQDMMKDVPLDKEEKKLLVVPLTACLKKWNKNLPPEALLLMGLTQITAARLTPLFV